MKIPRDLSGSDLIKALQQFGYERVRQSGSHVRISTEVNGQHHLPFPNHSPLKVGTLSGILKALAHHHKLPLEALLEKIARVV